MDAPGALPLAAFLLGWGGLSVHCQSLPFWRAAGVRPGPYLRAKFLQGMLAAGLTMLASACLPLSVPAMAPLSESWRPGLFHNAIFALFVLAGVSFLRFPQKRGEKTGKDGYNRPVSYTHLDSGVGLQAVLFLSVSSLPLPGAVGLTEGGFLLLYQTAVSYTHLDVYKRQRVDPPAWDILLPYSIGRKVCPMNLIPCTDPCI